jgi:hypothetical protein
MWHCPQGKERVQPMRVTVMLPFAAPPCRFEVLDSHFHFDASHYSRPLHSVPVTDFFGSVSAVQPTPPLSSTAGDLGSTAGELSSTALQPPPAAAAAATEADADVHRGHQLDVSNGQAVAQGHPAAAAHKLLTFDSSSSTGSSSGSLLLPASVYWGLLGLLVAVTAAAAAQPRHPAAAAIASISRSHSNKAVGKGL